jgi:hypothetical protein
MYIICVQSVHNITILMKVPLLPVGQFLGRITRKLPCKTTCRLGKSVADFAELAEDSWQDLTAVKGACVSTYVQGLFFECL